MSRYIDADELKRSLWAKIREEEVPKGEVGKYILEDFIEMVAHFPTAEVAEVKHGRWLYEGKRGRFPVCRCSVCGNEENADWAVLGGNVNYCPNCGALMVNDEVEE